jgi:hypothetical protein
MSKKDKRLLIVICIVSSILLSLVLTEIRLRFSNDRYAKGAYKKTEEALKAIQKLDSTYITN